MSATPEPSRRRPLGVAVIAAFLFVDALLAVLQVSIDTPLTARMETLLEVSDLAPVAMLLLAAVRVVAAVGLWMGSRRAWVLTMVAVGIGLVTSLYLYFAGEPSYLRLAIDVVIAFYLNQGAVRDHFMGRAVRSEPILLTDEPAARTSHGDPGG